MWFSFSTIRNYIRGLSLQKIGLMFGVGLCLIFLFIQTQKINIEAHNNYNYRLLRFKEQDAILNQDIVKIRQGLILHYDPLVNHIKQLENTLENLTEIPDFIGRQDKNNIKQKIKKYSDLLTVKEGLIENFKSQHGILKNSLIYFPIIANESVIKITNQVGNQKLAKDLNLFLQDLLIYNLNSTEDLAPRIKQKLENVFNNKEDYRAILGGTNFDNMMTHGRIIIKNKPEVDTLIKEATSLPTLQQTEQIYQTYTNYYKDAVNVTNNYRKLLFVIILLLLGYVAYFIEVRRQIVEQVKQTVEQVNFLVEENDGDIKQLSEKAYQQSQDIIHTLNSVEKMASSIQQVANNATEAATVANTSSKIAEQSGHAMEKTVKSFFTLQSTLTETQQKIAHLSDSSLEISQIINFIEHIAKQTKILSLNASIEAVRSGQDGKGFKVIADEINRLSLQTSEGIEQIKQMVTDIQADTQAVVQGIELGNNQILTGNDLVNNTEQSLEKIIEISREIDNLVKSISTATVSQAETSQSVTTLIKQIAQLSKRTSNSSRQISSSLEETVLVTQKLQKSIS